MKVLLLTFSLAAFILVISGASILEKLSGTEKGIAQVAQHFPPSHVGATYQEPAVNIPFQNEPFLATQKPANLKSRQSQRSQILQPKRTERRKPAASSFPTSDPGVVAPAGNIRFGPNVGSSTERRTLINAALRTCPEGEKMDEYFICRTLF